MTFTANCTESWHLEIRREEKLKTAGQIIQRKKYFEKHDRIMYFLFKNEPKFPSRKKGVLRKTFRKDQYFS